ncbi:hypothetical protein U3516DRAFT_771334 [Neocallimastix sp. 'constans']
MSYITDHRRFDCLKWNHKNIITYLFHLNINTIDNRIHYDCQLKETFNRRDFLLLKPNTINIIECLKESSLDKKKQAN